MHSSIFIGIDGGGSTTRCVVMNEAGVILGFGASASSNYHDVGLPATKSHIREAILNAYPAIFSDSIKPRGIFFGMAGVISVEDRYAIHSVGEELGLTTETNCEVDHDIRIALAGGTAGKPGIALIVGTGSSCYGRNSDGQTWRSGGWGHILDDEGSGYALGLEAIKAATRMIDGRGEVTALHDRVIEFFNLARMEEIQRAMSQGNLNRSRIATFGPQVLKLETSDPVAAQIVESGAVQLVKMVVATAGHLGFSEKPFDVVLTGGAILHSERYQAVVREKIVAALPNARVRVPVFPPVIGAAILALHHPEQLSETMEQNIRTTRVGFPQL